MKISQEVTPFQPVTLVLETQDEVDRLTDFLGRNKTTGAAGVFIDTLYSRMQKYREKGGHFHSCSFVE